MSDSVVASHRIFTGKIFSVDVDQVKFPNDTVGQAEVVRHPGGCAILPFLSDPAGADPQILLIRQYRYAVGGYIYEVPAGRLDPGEDPKDTAVRELKEETGCTAEKIEHLTTVYTAPGFTDEQIFIYMAIGLTRGESATEDDEFLEVLTVNLSRALQMIQQGEIRDAKSIVAILYAAGFPAGR